MSSLVIFSINVDRLAWFYEAVIGAEPIREESGDVRLVNSGDEILVHSIPSEIADRIGASEPVAAREDAPLKPVFDVSSIEEALKAVVASGGASTGRAFSFAGLARHDVLDPDGNIIQLRSVDS